MLVGAFAELLIKVAEGDAAVFCLPGSENCFEPTAHYAIDGLTEKLRLFKTKDEEEMKTCIKKYANALMEEKGIGLITLLYSLVLSRGSDRCLKDLQDQEENTLIDPMGECTMPLLNLIVTGRCSPYLHNGIMTVGSGGDDEFGGEERLGVVGRNEIGFLLFEYDDERTEKMNLGSRLKTPVLPIWVTMCNAKVGVLFNPNRELMRSYHMENRFQLYYYSDPDVKKEDRKETMLTIDTRNLNTSNGANDDGEFEETPMPLLDRALQSKSVKKIAIFSRGNFFHFSPHFRWEGCEVDWHGTTPYV